MPQSDLAYSDTGSHFLCSQRQKKEDFLSAFEALSTVALYWAKALIGVGVPGGQSQGLSSPESSHNMACWTFQPHFFTAQPA